MNEPYDLMLNRLELIKFNLWVVANYGLLFNFVAYCFFLIHLFMKNKYLTFIFIFVISLSCSSNDTDNEIQTELTDAEITDILNENWETVVSLIEDDYLHAESPSQLGQYINQIKQLKYIKDAYIDDSALHIITDDGSGWHWLFTPKEKIEDADIINDGESQSVTFSQSRLSSSKYPLSHTSQRKDGEKVKVLIFNQTIKDANRIWTKNTINRLSKYLTEQGFEVIEKGSNYSMGDLDKYDICLLHTHGVYSDSHHYLLSGVEKSVKLGRSDEFGTVTEVRNGKLYAVTYYACNEDWVQKMNFDLSQHNTFLFVTACESLKNNDKLAKKFIDKGAIGYVGYDSKASVGICAADHFLRKLCDDYSIQEAIDDIPQKYKFEHEAENQIVNATMKYIFANKYVNNYCYAHICPAGDHPHLIDMGNGTRWSCCNIGAQSPYDVGDYYSWGETSTKHDYSYNDNLEMKNDIRYPGNIAHSKYDVAWQKSGNMVRMPTTSDFNYLINNCNIKWEEGIGVDGALLTSRVNGNKLFIPAGGWIFEGAHMGKGECGILWSANRDSGSPFSWFMQAIYNDGNPNIHIASSRYSGHNVRGVANSE